MAQRSYVMTDTADGFVAVLEAGNSLPLLWLGLLDAAGLDQGIGPGATLRLVDGPAVGVTLEAAPALARLAACRTSVSHWIGEPAAQVLDQLGAWLERNAGPTLRLDVSEWVDLFGSPDDALVQLREMLRALHTPQAKRRPKLVKDVLERQGLIKLDANAPAFGVLLAGTACSGVEPWRREPPRERRRAGDRLLWSDRRLLSADGQVLATTVKNVDNVETPVVWNRATETAPRLWPVTDASIGHLHPWGLSADGRWITGSLKRHPGGVDQAFRMHAAGVEILAGGTPNFFLPICSNPTAGVVAGCFPKPYVRGSWPEQAAVWRADTGVRALRDATWESKVTHLSDDGAVLAGMEHHYTEGGSLAKMEALVWRGDAAPERVAEFFSVKWVALSPDGNRGVMRVMTASGEHGEPRFWRAGASLQALPWKVDFGRSGMVVSPAVTCVLAAAPEGLVLWRPDADTELLLAGAEVQNLMLMCVASSGDWFVAEEIDRSNHSTSAIVLWQRGRGVSRHPLPPSDTRLGYRIEAANACESIDRLVLMGSLRESREPLHWTLAHGFVHWGAVPDGSTT